MYSLPIACERSICDYVQSNITGSYGVVDILRGETTNDKESAKYVCIVAHSGPEIYQFTNIYKISVSIEVREAAADTDDDDVGVLAAYVFNMFFDPNRERNFSNDAYSFAIMQMQPQSLEVNIDGDMHLSRLTLECVCCLK